MMTRIAEAAERVPRPRRAEEEERGGTLPIPAAIADAAVGAAEGIGASALVVFTISGTTARLLDQRRSPCPIHAFSPVPETCRRLAMVWGVEAHPVRLADATDELIDDAEDALLKLNAVKKGDTIVLVAGTTPLRGTTNVVKVLRVR